MNGKNNFSRYRKANPVLIPVIIDSVIKKLNCESTFYFNNLKKNWTDIVGSTSARNTDPVLLKNDVLTVAVASPVWLTELRLSKKEILDKINNHETSGTVSVKDIKFSLIDYKRSSM